MNAITKSFTGRKRIRKSFGRIGEVAPMPNLIDVQRASYEAFLQMNVPPDSRTNTGLQEVFKSVFPIDDFSGRGRLEFVYYELEEPKYDVEECIQRGLTYAAPLKVILRLIVWDLDEETGAKSIRDIKEQPVYMGDMPLMTDNGTFIINGTERVIVSQMHRSPGVFFDHDKGKTHSSGKFLFAARVIPYRGSWLDFEFDSKDMIYVRIDRKRKLPVTTLLYALESASTAALRAERVAAGEELDPGEVRGMDAEEILNYFYGQVVFTRTAKGWARRFEPEAFKNIALAEPLVDADTGEVVAEAGTKLTQRTARKIAERTSEVLVGRADLLGRFVAVDMVNEETGEIYAEAGEELAEARLAALEAAGIDRLPTLAVDQSNGPWLRNTLAIDKNTNRDDALLDIYRVMRPGEPPTAETAEALFRGLFFDPDRYDLSAVGRVKMNIRLGLDAPDTVRTLRKEDILRTVKAMIELKDQRGTVDDIDNLGNRRVRSVGELMENQYRVGLLRMERAIRERMGSVDIDTVMPHDLINAKPAAAAVREFFGSSQLSQFMDQTNPLSEVTHKRRLSALGPGGLTRERAGFEVRDVHPTHYGRICPIETPEGPNIGLINSLATYAKVNKYGFIETPYRLVENGQVQDGWKYLSAMEEERLVVAQADAKQDAEGRFTDDLVSVRRQGDFRLVRPEDVTAIDVSPKQLVSVAAALIPFLENDDANRALMGSNMQRQAVPLIRADAPLVGTGMEAAVARDSGATIVARRPGVVDQIDGARIVVRATNEDGTTRGVDIYRLRKFMRSNQSTCINQRPLVRVGDRVFEGDIIADGPSTELGELALGRNVLVAFMPWNGYNFEDSILISERIARDDVFTSIHIEEFEVMARDTKLGQEEITRDIPNVGEESLKNLDEAGIVYIGAEVNPGDILVGKVTPKGESPMTPEEKLLRAIFGEKASDVRDTSLRLPPGVTGTVVDVRVFSRRGVDKDERAMAIERAEIERLAKDRDDERAIQERSFLNRLREKLLNRKASGGFKGIKSGTVITDEVLAEHPRGAWRHIGVQDDAVMAEIETLKREFDAAVGRLQARFDSKVEKLQRGDELPPGVMKMVKVFIAVKRKLQPGDKMAGRHGNKGVVSRVTPLEDMPFLEDGTPVDLVLNPLGVPSRMNVGQILETHLGWACATLGRQVGALVEEYRRGGAERDALLDHLRDIYGPEIFDRDIADLDNDQLIELAENLRKGIPIATPVFDGARMSDIEAMLVKAGLDTSGQVTLVDGRTGEPFERKVTVGYIYMLKLHHLVDDKIHARSIGPYSLVTQQPLGGKAQFGGQRFGEMEVWALEAYGAAYTLQEMLTVKSDDVSGRTKVYEAIVREQDNFEAGIPESFNVLVKELKSLGLNVDLDNRAA
ncbi:DNA-directed RNA polymerase subunit beta [Acidisphaera rubrifaciens]|uniref:DNA-directed RNA polymerase subunit beta n=1 Tax=Acidisphaera rubrifaciens HS-AP3 TaxID=1231350 RepID=A0A0D6P5R5_9PROT|nr:DNA-directed RNA polymerase subunit beta [Acidisphaera rubrifaciens]GAN76214.1 DNA-directed RNA polymerase subunit beta [Acidisphaera rubrifaciens HS-AP3]